MRSAGDPIDRFDPIVLESHGARPAHVTTASFDALWLVEEKEIGDLIGARGPDAMGLTRQTWRTARAFDRAAPRSR